MGSKVTALLFLYLLFCWDTHIYSCLRRCMVGASQISVQFEIIQAEDGKLDFCIVFFWWNANRVENSYFYTDLRIWLNE